jgi:hypothetical protein
MGYPKRMAAAKSMAVGWDNYVNYLSNIDERQDRVGQGTAKPATVVVYIKPFTLEQSNTQFIEARANQSIRTALGAPANTYAPITIGGTDTSQKIDGFKTARVVKKTGISARGTRAVSRRTKLPYLNYGGSSGSVAFGKGGTTKTQQEIFEEFKATDTAATVRWSLIPEKA